MGRPNTFTSYCIFPKYDHKNIKNILFVFLLGIHAGKLINLINDNWSMRKLLAIIESIFHGGASIDYVKRTRVSKPPGDVTDIPHN